MERETLACTLSESELADRIQEWAQVTSRATSRRVESGRIVSTYPPDDDLLQQVRELIAAEAECCTFMQFTLKEKQDGFEVQLRVPDDKSETLAVMLGLVAKQPGSAPQPAST